MFVALAVASSFTSVAADARSSPLVLLQQRAEIRAKNELTQSRFKSDLSIDGIGETVPLSEKGYQVVAALRSDIEMKKYIRRVAEKEARRITDEAELSGLAPYYSGTTRTQSLETLKQELRRVPWIVDGEGRSAPLNEAGYQQVAKLKSKAHMFAYARRLLDLASKKCMDEGAMHGLMPYFDGEVSIQSFDKLNRELLSAPWAVSRDNSIPQVSLSAKQVSSQSENGPFDILGWFRHDESDSTKAAAKDILKKVDEKADANLEDADQAKTDDEVLRSALKAKKSSSDEATEENEQTGAKDGSSKKSKSEKRTHEQNEEDQHADTKDGVSSESSEVHQEQDDTKRCDDWCSKEMFVKVEANSTVMKNLSSWGMKCSWAYCGGCSACSDPSLKFEEPPHKKHDGKQQLSVASHTCEDWCSSDEFEVVHQNATATNKFSWDMKCGWVYCSACGQCSQPAGDL